MPLQNRVDAYGEIVSISARGAWMGNRGCLHNAERQLNRTRWARKQWVICELRFNERHRHVMTPGAYTELFFLDEATALAAGHRPCGTCRKSALAEFTSKWEAVNGEANSSLAVIDETLHLQRAPVIGKDALPVVKLGSVPDRCMVAPTPAGDPHLVLRGKLFRWSFEGYCEAPGMSTNAKVVLITPLATRDVLSAGYRPQIHATADEGSPTAGRKKADSAVSIKAGKRTEEPTAISRSRMAIRISSQTRSAQTFYRLRVTPSGKVLFAYFAAILQVTGMERGETFPLKKFITNFSGHESAGRIVKAGPGLYRLSETGIDYFRGRFNPRNPQYITQEEVDRLKGCILRGHEEGWEQISLD